MFVGTERRKLERAAHDKAIALITILAGSLIAVLGVTLLLLGLVYWIAPIMGTGPAYTVIGGLVCLLSVGTALVVHRVARSPELDP